MHLLCILFQICIMALRNCAEILTISAIAFKFKLKHLKKLPYALVQVLIRYAICWSLCCDKATDVTRVSVWEVNLKTLKGTQMTQNLP